MRSIVSCSFVVLLFVGVAPSAIGGDLRVPADYATIQAAINAASAGDTIHVAAGTYYENIDFIGKDVVIISDTGPASTIIDGGGIDSVVKFLHGETPNAVLQGFTITNGYGYVGYCNCTSVGGGIVISEELLTYTPSNPTIRGNVIVQNAAKDGGGIFSSFCEPRLIGNLIASNTATNRGGGVWIGNPSLGSGQAILSANTIVANSASNGGGLEVDHALAQVTNCILWSNTGGEIALENGASATVESSDVEGGASGTGNIDSDPIFVDPSNGDFHLADASPCIDVGDDSDPNLSAQDIDGDWRILGVAVDIGADELRPAPSVFAVSPSRTRYDVPESVTISGAGFAVVSGVTVSVGGALASNVVLVDDATITCDLPGGVPGPADVVVSDSIGSGTLAGGFVYTPAITLDGSFLPGGTVNVHYLCDPLDGIFAVYGLPPVQSLPTPPFHGNLCVLPFNFLVYIPSWPFNDLTINGTIPNDPSLSGVTLLLQALVGPGLTGNPKDGAWTNCAVLSIR